MSDMTLQEALQTPEVQTYLNGLIESAVEERLPDAVKAAVEEQMPALRESVREEIASEGQLDALHAEARVIIESATLPRAAKDNLLSDYALTEIDGQPKPGRGLALIEAVKDGEGKVTKTAKAVLREALDEDIKRQRNVLRESVPAVPFAPGGGADGSALQEAALDPNDPVAARLREKGLDPTQFGFPAPPDQTPATATT